MHWPKNCNCNEQFCTQKIWNGNWIVSTWVISGKIFCKEFLKKCFDFHTLSILQVILDQKLGLFTSDKFLSGASGPALKSLCLVAEKVILHYPDEPNKRWLRAISMALTHSDSSARSFANFATKRLGNTLGGLETLKQLGKQLSLFIWQNLGKYFISSTKYWNCQITQRL